MLSLLLVALQLGLQFLILQSLRFFLSLLGFDLVPLLSLLNLEFDLLALLLDFQYLALLLIAGPLLPLDLGLEQRVLLFPDAKLFLQLH